MEKTDLPPPPENVVVKRVRRKRTYTPEQRKVMLGNLEKARAAARASKGRQKKHRDKAKLVAKMKRERARHAENQKVELEYNELMGNTDEPEEEQIQPQRRKKRAPKPRKVKKQVRYYEEPDEEEDSSSEWEESAWIEERPPRAYRESDEPRHRRRRGRPSRDPQEEWRPSHSHTLQQNVPQQGYTADDLALAKRYRQRMEAMKQRYMGGQQRSVDMNAVINSICPND